MPHALVTGIAPTFRNPRSLESALTSMPRLFQARAHSRLLYSSSWRLEQQLDENLFPPLSFTPAGTRSFLIAAHRRCRSPAGRAIHRALQLSRRLYQSQRSHLPPHHADRKLHVLTHEGRRLQLRSVQPRHRPQSVQPGRRTRLLDDRPAADLQPECHLQPARRIQTEPVLHRAFRHALHAIIGFDTQNDANDWNDRATLNSAVAPRDSFANRPLPLSICASSRTLP